MRNSYFGEWLYYIIAWTIITITLSYVSLLTVRYFIDFFELSQLLEENPLAAYMVSDYQFLESLLFGIGFGTFIFLINLLVDQTNIHKMSFGRVLLLKSLLYTLSIFLMFLIVYSVIAQYPFFDTLEINFEVFAKFITPSSTFFFLTFFILTTLLINFIAQINKKFGPGNLLDMFIGKYHRPRVEDRIFLFIDLKNSTTIAEKLGHLKYSRLLQSSFMDINRVVPKYHAEIYQYVGDEAVITWRTKRGLKNLACVRFFFSFQKRIYSRSEYYMKKYGVVPEFKAGIHLGEITVAEVGFLKREIAYHGDVINTASRVQDLCSKYGKSLLATRAVIQFIPDSDYNINFIEKKLLKGKHSEEEIFNIEEIEYQ